MNKVLTAFKKFLSFILVWVVISFLLSFDKPQPKTPSEYFNICVIKNQTPINIDLKEHKDEPFCDTPLKNIPMNNPVFHFHLDNIDNEWEMTTFTDSMADPFVYRYKIENGKAIPLWWNYGGNAWKMSVVVGGFFGAVLFFPTIRTIKRIYEKHKTSNTPE